MQSLKVRFLTGLSLGLGVGQLLLPDAIARLAGIPQGTAAHMVLRMVGLRELLTGIGMVSTSTAAPWVWARVGGDLLDLALLGATVHSPGARRAQVISALTIMAAITALDLRWGEELSIEEDVDQGRVAVTPGSEHQRPRRQSPGLRGPSRVATQGVA
jgi:hypothetical protein